MEIKKVKNFLNKNNGYIQTKDFAKLGISKPQIVSYVENEIIRKVYRGIYIDNDLIEDEFYILQKRYPNAIFSFNTAMFFLGLSDRTPYQISVTTIKNHKIKENLEIHYVVDNRFNIGIITIKSPYGNPIKIYNAERCICDIIRQPNYVDTEVYNKVIKNYFRSNKKNIVILEKYAKKLGVYEKLVNIMEVLM